MPVRKKWLWCWLGTALLLWSTAAAGKETVRAVFTNSQGVKAERFRLMDSVFGSFCGLKPGARYDIRIVDGNNREVSACAMNADRRGIIPSVALWWDIGGRYDQRRRFGVVEFPGGAALRFFCRLQVDGRTVAEFPLTIDPAAPCFYACNSGGRPGNGFAMGRDDVFIAGRNLPPRATYDLYLVADRYSWRIGDEVMPIVRPVPARADEKGNLLVRVWPAQALQPGSYDIVIRPVLRRLPLREGLVVGMPQRFTELLVDRPATATSPVAESVERIGRAERVTGAFLDLRRLRTTLEAHDLVRSVYPVGFTVFKFNGGPAPLETDIACQAPPHDSVSGAVIGAPNPFYKNTFSPQEEVWAAVNPTFGGVDMAGTQARLYVVNQRTAAEWTDGLALGDVSADSFELVTIQPGCANHNYHRIWANPAVRDEGYDVVVDYPPFGIYNAGQDLVDRLDAKGFVVPTNWVSLANLTLNHNSASVAADAINIRRNFTQEITLPEWQPGLPSSPAAYIVNKAVTIKGVFSAGAGVTSARIRATVDIGPMGAIASQLVTFAGGTSGAVYLPVTGLTPNSVRYTWQKWRWYVSDVNGSGSAEVEIASTQNLLYVVLDQPQGPWTTSGQTKPWTEVLDKSCMWAYGETTAAGAAGRIANYIYNTLGGLYDYGPQYTSGHGQAFAMTNFLANIPDIGIVNCYDMGKALVSFSDVLGCNLVYRFTSPWGALNCSKAVGCAWKCDEWFSNHGFGTILPDTMFDACLVIDGDATPNNPPSTVFWLLNILWNDYKNKVMENPAGVGTPTVYSFTVN